VGGCEEIANELVKLCPEDHDVITHSISAFRKEVQSEEERDRDLLHDTHREVFCCRRHIKGNLGHPALEREIVDQKIQVITLIGLQNVLYDPPEEKKKKRSCR